MLDLKYDDFKHRTLGCKKKNDHKIAFIFKIMYITKIPRHFWNVLQYHRYIPTKHPLQTNSERVDKIWSFGNNMFKLSKRQGIIIIQVSFFKNIIN